MDPITITTTLITFSSFIKDLIEIGQSIQSSIEKVGENRRRIRELTKDVLCTLANLANLTRGQEDTFQAPALLSALGNLKAEMLHVLSTCYKISPVQRPGFRGVGSQIKAWMKRDDLEKKIGHLKEHVNKCYLQFTAFSAARIEHTTVRVEQTLILNGVESQVKLRRLEGMMARVLLETQFGQNVLNQTIEAISSDPSHKNLESQYLSVQTMQLIEHIRKLSAGGNLVLELSSLDPKTKQILLEFNEGCTSIETDFMWDIMVNLGVRLDALGMVSESMAWELLKIQIFRCLAGSDCSPRILQDLAHSLYQLSCQYRYQLQYLPALQASQQSLDLWHHLSESSLDVYRSSLLTAMVLHVENLLQADQKMDALSIAQDATALSRSMAEQIIQLSLTERDKFEAVQCHKALFVLANALSSSDRHLESYAAFMEGFQTAIELPVSEHPPAAKDIDSFINQICKVAEEEQFSLVMLADCVILFCNLAHIHPKNFSSQFLWLLYAYAHFSHQDAPPDSDLSLKNLRIFLEPNSDCPPPQLDRGVHIDDFNAQGGIVEDAVRAFYTWPSYTTTVLIRNIFITHFNQAIIILREVVDNSDPKSSTIQWALYSIIDIITFVSGANRMALLQILSRTVKHTDTILTCQGSGWRWWLDERHEPIVRHLWRAGLLEEALAESEQVIKYLRSCSDQGDVEVVERLQWFRIYQHFILCDMGRFPEAIQMIQQTNTNSPENDAFCLHPCLIQTRILRCTGRNQEVLQLLRRGVADGSQKFWTDNSKVYHIALYILLVELAAAWGHVGQPEKALTHAEQAAAACRKDVGDDKVEQQKCTLIHSLTTLSNCLAAVGRNKEALAISHEAVSIYTQSMGQIWDDFLFTIRKQELGANAFHSLSLRLTTAGELNQAIVNAEKATKLYRELVALAPRHLPILASSLQNLALILWNVSHQEEAIAACEEAVGIMRKVVHPETYFLPALADALDQLVGYLTEKGDINSASAAATESIEVRRTYTSLPPGPDFLFEKIRMESDDEDNEEEEGAWETALEGDDEYYNVPMDTDMVILDATHFENPVSPSMDHTAMFSFAALEEPEGPAVTDTALVAKGSLTEILSKPLEVRMSMSMNMRGTPMDILWWMLVGILFVAMWSHIV
ncbi:hypothetical protein B0H13DRAFT_2577891 [Mycena leptocephala]|nr:hypothetical protein B0H13DRAFT_2577891 [Mycena leptocephala]